ncbi:MAG: transporter substrate-binding domain-containing protein [Desulfobacterales bacterium]|jgi:polar amino acid transport system substrate-binding protein
MPKIATAPLGAFLLTMVLVLGTGASPCYPDHATINGPVLTRILHDGNLRVGVNPHFEPFSYAQTSPHRSATGAHIDARVGIDIDIAALLARELGVDLEIVVPDRFDQLIPMLQAGKIDIAIAALSRVFERALRVDFSDPYFHTGFSILLNVVKGYPLGIGDAQSFRELKDSLQRVDKESQLVIAVTRNKSAAGFIRGYFPQAKIKAYETNEAAAEAVLQGRDLPGSPQIMVHDETFLKLWAGILPRKERQKITLFPKPFRSDTYGFAVAKGNLAFLQILNLFISDKLTAEEHMLKFTRSRHYRFIPGLGIEPIDTETSDHGNL